MAQSNVSCSCLSSAMLSASATSHTLQCSYVQLPNSSSPQVALSVSYQNGICRDTESLQYDGEHACYYWSCDLQPMKCSHVPVLVHSFFLILMIHPSNMDGAFSNLKTSLTSFKQLHHNWPRLSEHLVSLPHPDGWNIQIPEWLIVSHAHQ